MRKFWLGLAVGVAVASIVYFWFEVGRYKVQVLTLRSPGLTADQVCVIDRREGRIVDEQVAGVGRPRAGKVDPYAGLGTVEQ